MRDVRRLFVLIFLVWLVFAASMTFRMISNHEAQYDRSISVLEHRMDGLNQEIKSLKQNYNELLRMQMIKEPVDVRKIRGEIVRKAMDGVKASRLRFSENQGTTKEEVVDETSKDRMEAPDVSLTEDGLDLTSATTGDFPAGLFPRPDPLGRSETGSPLVSMDDVRQFHELKLDWHDLVPKTNSFDELVRKEKEVTRALLGIPQPRSSEEQNHGPEIWKVLSETCGPEGLNTKDVLDSWAAIPMNQITDVSEYCGNPGKLFRIQGEKSVSVTGTGSCKYLVPYKVRRVSITDAGKAMLFHALKDNLDHLFKGDTTFYPEDTLILYHKNTDKHWKFWNWFQLTLSTHCALNANDVPYSYCFVEDGCTSVLPSGQPGFVPPAHLDNMGLYVKGLAGIPLTKQVPAGGRKKLVIVQRVQKRFIVNIRQLYDLGVQMGFDTDVVYLEDMTLYEQVLTFHHADILVAIHGSALTNVRFMRPGTHMIEIAPYKTAVDIFFKPLAANANVRYHKLQIKDKSNAFFHLHFLAPNERADIDQTIRLRGSSTGAFFFSFLIQQDVIVPENEWKQILQQLL